MDSTPELPPDRPHCWRCSKPASMCVCATIQRLRNRTAVLVIQHPRERAHPVGTSRFVELGLSHSEVLVANTRGQDLHVPMQLPPGAALLFPHPEAQELNQLPPEEHPTQIVALDGTWPQARSLYRANPWLAGLPHVSLSPTSPSRYRLRKEPRENYVSTLESILLALQVIEPELQVTPLLDAFDAMQDAQFARIRAAGDSGRRSRIREPRAFDRIPRWLGEEFDALTGVYVETYPRGRRKRSATLVQLTAVRFESGETFERHIWDRAHPDAEAIETVLRADGVVLEQCAGSAKDAIAELEAFADGDAIVTWNESSVRCLRDSGFKRGAHRLRPVLKLLESRPGKRPTLASHLEAQPRVGSFAGRAAERMHYIHGVATWARGAPKA